MLTLIRGGRVLHGDLQTCGVADVLIDGGMIEAIEPPGTITDHNAEIVDAADRLLVPGLVNGHTHSHGALGKGLVGDRVPLEVFLSGASAVSGNRGLADKKLSATLVGGRTRAQRLHRRLRPLRGVSRPTREGMDAVAEAYAAVGIRAVVAPMMADRTLYQALPGLTESFPAVVQEEVLLLAATPFEQSIAACRTSSITGPTIVPGCARRWARPSLCIARMTSTACRDQSPRVRRAFANPSRRDEDAGSARQAALRQRRRTWSNSASSVRRPALPTRSGSRTTISLVWQRRGRASCTIQ